MMRALQTGRPAPKPGLWVHVGGARVIDLRPNRGDKGAQEALRHSLEMGAAAEQDPKRVSFYETSLDGYRYYFHVAPSRPPRVYLLARWPEP
jgi:hypothetical protein